MRDRLTFLALAAVVVLLTACRVPSSVAPSASPVSSTTTTPTPSLTPATEVSELALTVGGAERRILLVAPREADGPVPLVIAFHGLGGTPEDFLNVTGLSSLAQDEGWMVAFPAGFHESWNAGTCCGDAVRGGIDDVAFISALITSLEDPAVLATPADPGRIFVTGFSNGGMLAYRLGCELADQIVAIAPVAGGLLVDDCQPAEAVSLLAMHGTADAAVPYEGNGQDLASVEDTVARWAAFDGCGADPTRHESPRRLDLSWLSCEEGSRVMMTAALEQGHTWFTADPIASEEVWAFFSALRRE